MLQRIKPLDTIKPEVIDTTDVDLTLGQGVLHTDMYDSVNRYYTFTTMWKAALIPYTAFFIDQVIVDWYIRSFGDKPPLDISRRDLITIVSYELLYNGYIATGKSMTEKFLQNYQASKQLLSNRTVAISKFSQTSQLLFRIEQEYSDYLNEPLNFKRKDDIMSTAQKDTQSAESTEQKKPGRGRKKAEGTEATPKMSDLMKFFFDKLMEKKMTDEQIALAAKAQFGDSYNGNPGYIVICRQNIGKGKYGEAVQLERLIDYKGKIVPISKVPEGERDTTINEAKKALRNGSGTPSPAKAAAVQNAKPAAQTAKPAAQPAPAKKSVLPTRKLPVASGSNPVPMTRKS